MTITMNVCRSIVRRPFVPTIHLDTRHSRYSYTTVLTRKVASSITDALSLSDNTPIINVQRAISQHDEYVKVLRGDGGRSNGLKLGLGLQTVIEIEADESYPDCVFIEDTAVVISNSAVITNIGAESRKGEVDAVKTVLMDLGMEVHDMRMREDSDDGNVDVPAPVPTLDGGDVLYPVTSMAYPGGETGGRHLFVGLSSRTNLKGVEYLKDKFRHVEVVPVDIKNMNMDDDDSNSPSLHLKSIVTHIDEKTLLVPSGKLGDKISKAMDLESRGYDVIRLNDLSSCNVVSINGNVLAQPTHCVETTETLKRAVEERGMNLLWVEADEFAKVDGALTCKSILL